MITVEKKGDDTYEASINLTTIQAGRTPQEAIGRLIEGSHDVRLYVFSHPEIMEQLFREYGPQTDEEKVALFKRVWGG